MQSDRLISDTMVSPNNPRVTVCRDWLGGNCPENQRTCTKGIHQYDLSLMPMCPSLQNNEMCPTGARHCIYRHHCPIECIMYKMGFCPNGPNCFFTHVRRGGSPPSVGELIDFRRKAVHRLLPPKGQGGVQQPHFWNAPLRPVGPHFQDSSFPPSRPHFQNAQPGQQYAPFPPLGPHSQNEPFPQQYAPVPPARPHSQNASQPLQPHGQPRPVNNVARPSHHLRPHSFISGNLQGLQHHGGVPSGNGPLENLQNLVISLTGLSRYFVIKNDCPVDTLRYAAKSGLWSPHQDIRAKLNDAFSKCDHVILFFTNDQLPRKFEACAKMMSRVGDPVPGLWDDKTWEAKYVGEVFQIRFFKNSRDGQELDEGVGSQIFTILRNEPSNDLMEIAVVYGTNVYLQRDGRITLPKNEQRKIKLEMIL